MRGWRRRTGGPSRRYAAWSATASSGVATRPAPAPTPPRSSPASCARPTNKASTLLTCSQISNAPARCRHNWTCPRPPPVAVAGRRDPADPAAPRRPLPRRGHETTHDNAVDAGDDYLDDVVFDHTGDAFVVGVATVSGNRITAEVNHDDDQFLRERLTAHITNAVLEP